MKDDPMISALRIFREVLQMRWKAGYFMGIGLLVGLILSFVKITLFRANISLYNANPDYLVSPNTLDANNPFETMLTSPNPGTTFFIPDLVSSRQALLELVRKPRMTPLSSDSLTLVEFWGFTKPGVRPTWGEEVQAAEYMQSRIDWRKLPSGLIQVLFWMETPSLSSSVANSFLEIVQRTNDTLTTTPIRRARIHITERQQEIHDSLLVAEYQLTDFLKHNRGTLTAPDLILERARLTRKKRLYEAFDVQLKRLKQGYEVREMSRMPAMVTMDTAEAPTRKELPRRKLIIVISMALSICVLLLYVTIRLPIKS